jgi:hypothetical protein
MRIGEKPPVTVNGAVAVLLLKLAVRFTVVVVATRFVGNVIEALDEPAKMLKVVDATTAVFELVRLTVTPAAGATPLRVTLALVEVPPLTELGVRVRPVTVSGGIEVDGFTVNDAVAVAPL